MNFSGHAAGLCCVTLLMTQEHSRFLLQTEGTCFKKIELLNSGSICHQSYVLQITLPRSMNSKKFANTDRWFQGLQLLRKPQSSRDLSSVAVF